MRYLVDTHTLIWWWDDNPKLSGPVRSVLLDPESLVHVSAVSGWEIANKVRSGKLPEMATPISHYEESVVADGFIHLLVRPGDAVRAGMMEGVHRDPFDRILAAQALADDLILLTCDREIACFGCKVLWN